MTRVTVLFEDQVADGQLKNFGPGLLLTACVADQLPDATLHTLKRTIIAIPCGGDSKLLKRCQEQAGMFGGRMQALFDADRFATCLSGTAGVAVPKNSDCNALKAAWSQSAPDWPTRNVVLLNRNTETLVEVAAGLLKRGIPKKDRTERDIILNKLAHDPAMADARAELLTHCPSFELLVDRVKALL